MNKINLFLKWRQEQYDKMQREDYPVAEAFELGYRWTDKMSLNEVRAGAKLFLSQQRKKKGFWSRSMKDQETLNYENKDLQEQVKRQAEEIARLRRWLRNICHKIKLHDQYMGLRGYPWNIMTEYLATKNDGS